MRLDVYLSQLPNVASRTEAKNFIAEGAVKVNGEIIKKPAYEVLGTENIEVDTSIKKYVSRGGLKLEAALLAFSVNINGKLCIDIGASSGGFTDCLLKNGAEHVIAIDSGTAQLARSLTEDKRVTSIENYNARYMNTDDLEYTPSIAVMDVSFISAKLIIPSVYQCLSEGADYILLIKPQFEVGRAAIGKGGIVKSEKDRERALSDVVDFAKSVGFTFMGSVISPIVGGDGNIEYLAHFKKN